jgi:hypothetical protein
MPDNRQPLTTFATARKEKAAMSIALAGASGSGKTKTALELAVGIAGPDGSIGVIDTEGKRALHYARQYKFEHCDFSQAAPYTPERCTQAIEEAHARFDVVVFDSFSDEYEGQGGFLDLGEAEGSPGWPKTKGRHKDSIIRYIRRHARFTIFCLRAEEKAKFSKDDRGKLLITPLGWMPICEKRFMYDMTLSLTLSPETPGLPRYDLPRKLGDDFLPYFPAGKHITREAGAALRAWATDVDMPTAAPAADKAIAVTDGLIAGVEAATSEEKLIDFLSAEKEAKQIAALKERKPEQYTRLNDAIAAKRGALTGAIL